MGLIFGVAIIVLSFVFAVRVRKARKEDLNGMFGISDSMFSDDHAMLSPPSSIPRQRQFLSATFESHYLGASSAAAPVAERDPIPPNCRRSSLPTQDPLALSMSYGRLSSPGRATGAKWMMISQPFEGRLSWSVDDAQATGSAAEVCIDDEDDDQVSIALTDSPQNRPSRGCEISPSHSYATDCDYQMSFVSSSFISIASSPDRDDDDDGPTRGSRGAAEWMAAMDEDDGSDEIRSNESYEV